MNQAFQDEHPILRELGAGNAPDAGRTNGVIRRVLKAKMLTRKAGGTARPERSSPPGLQELARAPLAPAPSPRNRGELGVLRCTKVR
jgi:hypothetical protein